MDTNFVILIRRDLCEKPERLWESLYENVGDRFLIQDLTANCN